MIAGTSLFKIYKIKKSINKIFALCLNEDEIKILANKKTIKESINFVLRKNHLSLPGPPQSHPGAHPSKKRAHPSNSPAPAYFFSANGRNSRRR